MANKIWMANSLWLYKTFHQLHNSADQNDMVVNLTKTKETVIGLPSITSNLSVFPPAVIKFKEPARLNYLAYTLILTTYISQGNVATDLKGGGSYSYIFLHRSFLNLTVKNYESCSTFAEVVIKIKVAHIFWDTVYSTWTSKGGAKFAYPQYLTNCSETILSE